MSTTVRRGSSSPSLSSAVVIVLIGRTSCDGGGGQTKTPVLAGVWATFGVLVTWFARLGTPPALHGRGSTRAMHGVRPRGHRSRIVTSRHPTMQDPKPNARFRFGAIGLASDGLAGAYSRDVRVAPGMRWAC